MGVYVYVDIFYSLSVVKQIILLKIIIKRVLNGTPCSRQVTDHVSLTWYGSGLSSDAKLCASHGRWCTFYGLNRVNYQKFKIIEII